MPSRYRLAAIDVGTNSIHMIVVEALKRGFRVIDREKEMVQLGRGSLQGNPLTPAAMQRGIDALVRMGQIARRYKVDEILCVATSATREAPNGREFAREAEKASGIHIRIIQGEEEADYIWRAVRSAVDFHGGTALCVDIGGGSAELIAGTAEQVFFTRSEPLGALRLSQQFLVEDPPGDAAIRRCRRHVRKTLQKPMGMIRNLGFDFIVGTSGTITTLAELSGGAPDVAAGLRTLRRDALQETIARLASVSTEKRSSEFDLDPRRAESILAGGIIVDEILELAGTDSMVVAGAALREGIVHRALDARRPQAGPRESVRRSGVLDLAERSRIDRVHAQHVSRLAVRLFDQLAGLHAMRPLDREILEYAAWLSEVGQQVSWQRYHKHSYYVIRHAGLDGFTEDQLMILANVARYHRKASPKDQHENMRELTRAQRLIVRQLSVMLRTAHAMDRSKRQAIRDVGVEHDDSAITLHVRPRLDIESELARVEKAARRLGQEFGRKVRISVGSAV